MTAFGFAIFLTAAMTAVMYFYGKRRTPGAPITWGEAFIGGLFVFSWLLVIYGVLPDTWLKWCDGPLKWRKDRIGIPAGILSHVKILGIDIRLLHNGRRYLGFIPYDQGRLWPHGITFFGHGKINMNEEAARDIVATMIYGVSIFLNFKGFAWWQKRGKVVAATPELPTSAYGRPLVRRV